MRRLTLLLGLTLSARVASPQPPAKSDTAHKYTPPPNMGTDTTATVPAQPGLKPPGWTPGLSRDLDHQATDADSQRLFDRPDKLDLDSIAPPPAAPGVQDVIVDGRTGRILQRSLRFDPRDFVRVTVINVNPILFTYAITVGDTQVVAEASPADFFKLAFGITLPSTGAAAAAGVALSPEQLQAAHDSQLREFLEVLKSAARDKHAAASCVNPILELARLDFEMRWQAGLIQRTIVDANGTQEKLNSEYLAVWLSLQDARLGAKRVRYLAFVGDTMLHNVQKAMTEQQTSLTAEVAAHKALVDTLFIKQHAYGADKTCPSTPDFEADEATAANDTALFAKALGALTSAKGSTDKQRTLLDGIWSDETRFWKSLVLKRHDKGNDVIVTVARQRVAAAGADSSSGSADKPKSDTSADVSTTTTTTTATQIKPPPAPAAPGKSSGGKTASAAKAPSKPAAAPSPAAPFDTIAQPVLHYAALGRFSIGAGFVYGALRAPQYGTVQRRGAAPPGAPGDTLVNVVTLTDNSGYRVIPSVTLSTLVWDWHGRTFDGLHVTLGAGVVPKSGDVTVDYLIGLGVGLFDSRLLVSPGIYVGRKNYLLAGVRLGDQISTAAPPTGSRYQAQFGIGLTYRLY